MGLPHFHMLPEAADPVPAMLLPQTRKMGQPRFPKDTNSTDGVGGILHQTPCVGEDAPPRDILKLEQSPSPPPKDGNGTEESDVQVWPRAGFLNTTVQGLPTEFLCPSPWPPHPSSEQMSMTRDCLKDGRTASVLKTCRSRPDPGTARAGPRRKRAVLPLSAHRHCAQLSPSPGREEGVTSIIQS